VSAPRTSTAKVGDAVEVPRRQLTVPVDATFPYYSDVGEREDLPRIVMQQIEHFFTHYKDLEAEKWVRIGPWGAADEARRIIVEAIERAKARSTPVTALTGTLASRSGLVAATDCGQHVLPRGETLAVGL